MELEKAFLAFRPLRRAAGVGEKLRGALCASRTCDPQVATPWLDPISNHSKEDGQSLTAK